MHVQMSLLGSWVDAAVIMNHDQLHFGFMNLFSFDEEFVLEVLFLFV